MRLANTALAVASTLSLATLLACAPGLEGRYRLSGDFEGPEYARFSGELQVDDQGQGYALLDLADHPSVRVPLCKVQRSEQELTFTVERAYPPGRTCDGIARPLELRADIGGHVLAGEVRDDSGRAIGIWRATRRLE